MTKFWRTLSVFMFIFVVAGFTASAQQTISVSTAPPSGGTAQTIAPAQSAGTQDPLQSLLADRYTVGKARPPIVEGSELIELTLDQATALALEKNLDLKVARMNPLSSDYQLQTMRAAYRPNFNGSYGYTNSLTPSNNVLDGVASVTNISQSYNTSVSQLLKYRGGPSVSVSWGNGRTSTDNITTILNPSYSSNLNFSGSMQLLNGFKIDNQRNQWRVYPINREIVDIQLLNSIETTKNSVRTSYWQLRSAIEQIEIARRALELAKKNYTDSMTKVEIGTEASINTITFALAVDNAEQSVLSAQINWRTAELNFKRLLVSGTDDELYKKTINPTDEPQRQLGVSSVDIQAAVNRTLAEGTNLIIARKRIEVSRLNFEVTQQALLPSLSANGGYRASGQGGTSHKNGVTTPGGWGDALGVLGSFQNPTWNFGFSVTYRLGQLSEKANVATAQIALDQSVAQLKAQELTVATQVVNAGLNVENTYKLYQASIKSRESSERQAEATQIRFDNGLVTNFDVVTAQNQLTNARLSELTRLIAYVNAIAEFERVQKIGG